MPQTARYQHRPDDREAVGASYCLERRCGHWGWLPFLKVMWTAIACPKSLVFLQGGTPRGLSFCPAAGAQTLRLGQSQAHLSQWESQPSVSCSNLKISCFHKCTSPSSPVLSQLHCAFPPEGTRPEVPKGPPSVLAGPEAGVSGHRDESARPRSRAIV